jgi:glycosyltransferase involved in cell wall biosynthesis
MWGTLRCLSPDLVAINGIYPTMLVAAAWSHVHRRPLVFLTDGWAIMMPQSIYHRVTRPVVVSRSRAIICASEKGRGFFVDQGTDPRKIFVANIVPAWSGPADIPGFAQRRHDLLWCGRVNDERKNWPFFVSLVLELKRRLPALSVRIIADSPSKPKELDQLSGAEVAFEYSPHIPPDEISSVFTTARVLALPSKSDAWGLVCNEAMQCGTPCIVSPFVGAAGELVVDDACGLVRPLEVEQWAAAISLLISDPVRWSGMSDAAMQAASQYSLNQSARRYVDGLNFAAAGLPPGARKLASAR